MAAQATVTGGNTVGLTGDALNRLCTRIELLREIEKTLECAPCVAAGTDVTASVTDRASALN
jgi:hypothetical protein